MDWYRVDVNPVPWKVGPLSTNHRKSASGLRMTYATMGRNEELHDYQQAVKSALASKKRLYEGPCELVLYFWRRIETYKTEKSRNARNQEADWTNLTKATEDALHEIFYLNDKDNHVVRGAIIRQDSQCQGKVIIGIRSIALDEKFALLREVPNEVLDDTKVEELSEEDAKWAALRASDDDDF